MEPLSGFISIVSMLRIFKQERGERKKADHQAFMEWLDYHKHEELKNLIVSTAAIRAEVDNLLAAEHTAMLTKLDAIQEVVTRLLSRVHEFRGLSVAVAPDAQLSEQAIIILQQFADSGAETMYYASSGDGQFSLQPHGGEPFWIIESRFLKDDLEQLASLGLLSVQSNTGREARFALTRSGMRYRLAVGGKATPPEPGAHG